MLSVLLCPFVPNAPFPYPLNKWVNILDINGFINSIIYMKRKTFDISLKRNHLSEVFLTNASKRRNYYKYTPRTAFGKKRFSLHCSFFIVVAWYCFSRRKRQGTCPHGLQSIQWGTISIHEMFWKTFILKNFAWKNIWQSPFKTAFTKILLLKRCVY